MKELIEKIIKAGGKVPDRFAHSGHPKADAMTDATKLFGKTDKAQVIAKLEALAAAGLAWYRRDIQRVGLKPAALELVAPATAVVRGGK